jgi:hypothetical protein
MAQTTRERQENNRVKQRLESIKAACKRAVEGSDWMSLTLEEKSRISMMESDLEKMIKNRV